MNSGPSLLGAVVMAGLGVLMSSAPAFAQSRGELLHATHCTARHTSQMHWRDRRVATDWASLTLQVRRWQDAASLGWSEADVLEVAGYLNDSVCRFERVPGPVSLPAQPHATERR